LQHLDTGVLHRMKRPYRDVNTVKLVEKMRAAVPGLVMRTTMIVGFPGETDAEHERMLELVEEMRFERLGAFQYSQEEDTPAGVMPDQVPEEVKQERWEALMEVQSAIHGEHSASRVGEHTRVLVEGYDTEVDGMVYVQSETPLKPGDFVDVEITSAEVFDLFAIPV
jgi:ribosomal protein S12 methylthiotransferase